MVLLDLLVGAAYQVVRHSWMFAAVSVKYILALQISVFLAREEFSLERMLRNLENYSGVTVTGIVVVGGALAFTGVELSPVAPLFSELVALLYFGFLFWRY